MPIEPTTQEAERLLEEACVWLSKMHSGEFSSAGLRQLEAWRSVDPAHALAWHKAQCLWQGMDSLRGRVIPGSEPLLQERYPKPQLRHIAQSGYRRKLLPLAVACSAVLAVSLAVFYPPLLWQADYASGKGEQRSISLVDGSKVTLNSSSALAIHFNNNERRVELLQGEAFFEVAKRKDSPFVVAAAGSEVRAVGTAFNVQNRVAQIKVELLEGIVEIQDPQHRRQKRLQAGQTALIGANNIAVQTESQPENMALWRDGYLQFDGTPLHQAIDQINQYRTGRVILLNTALADKRVSGLFRLNALDQAITALTAAVPELQTVSITPYLVVLR